MGANDGGTTAAALVTGPANAWVGWASSLPTARPGTPPGGGGGGGTGAFGDMRLLAGSSSDSPGTTGRRALLTPPAT
ncbi:hypothetical protein FB00_19260 [Cellulosimicrobium funkei]|uniref:Uncharacterized protein n=1 Tax=Cellulosimicrobium funkei TaxID=264251 RepID=A0A0H2KHM4_9MICO|nr:hypothetical protein FB00_19260 [Cellulosimicrobium funkei]KZM76271.1 hypothetical protein A0J59_07105 [Cellulosimicrobium sp. I38E]